MTEPTHYVRVEGVEMYLRRADDGDRARVFRDWIMSYYDRSRCERLIYEREQRALIERLYPLVRVLYRTGSEVHGWVCGQPGLVHYVYVPRELRRHGAARAMVAAVGGDGGEHTHRRMRGLAGFDGWHFNPYRVGMVE